MLARVIMSNKMHETNFKTAVSLTVEGLAVANGTAAELGHSFTFYRTQVKLSTTKSKLHNSVPRKKLIQSVNSATI